MSRCARRWSAVLAVMAVAVVAAWRVLVSIETPRFVPAGEGSFVAARDTRIENIVLDGDGTTAYVVATIGSVNLWRMLTGWWPELLLGVLVLACVGAFLIARRRPPTAVDPHCRRCDYPLYDIEAARCPECGLELTPRRRVRGRRRRRVLAIPLVAALLPIGAYAATRSLLPREGAWRDRFDWPSSALFDWGYHRGGWITSLCLANRSYTCMLIPVDTVTGEVGDVIVLDRLPQRRTAAVAASDDRSTLLVTDFKRAWLVDPSAGSVRELAALKKNRQLQHVAMSGDGRRAWLLEPPSLRAYHTDTGELAREIELAHDRAHFVMPLDQAGEVLVVGYDFRVRKTFSLWYDAEGVARSQQVDVTEQVLRAAAAADDGTWWVGAELQRGLVYLAETGSRRIRIEPNGLSRAMVLSPDERRIALARKATFGENVLLLIEVGTWSRTRLPPSGSLIDLMAFSGDGRTLAVAGSSLGGAGRRSRITFYGLSETPDSDPASGPDE